MHSLRSARLLKAEGGGVQDVHRANIVAMKLTRDQTQLWTLCARGLLAEWSTDTNELLATTQLAYEGGKAVLVSID